MKDDDDTVTIVWPKKAKVCKSFEFESGKHVFDRSLLIIVNNMKLCFWVRSKNNCTFRKSAEFQENDEFEQCFFA